MLIHVAAQYWDLVPVSSADWMALNVYDGLARWAVPAFVMISGSLMFDPRRGGDSQEDLEQEHFPDRRRSFGLGLGLRASLPLAGGPYVSERAILLQSLDTRPLSYVVFFMIIGLCIVTPLLRRVVLNRSSMRLFLLVTFVFAIAVPAVCEAVQATAVLGALDKTQVRSIAGCPFYYVLEYWLNTFREKAISLRKAAIALGAVGLSAVALLTAVVSVRNGEALQTFYGNFALAVCMSAAGIYATFSCVKVIGSRTKTMLKTLRMLRRERISSMCWFWRLSTMSELIR